MKRSIVFLACLVCLVALAAGEGEVFLRMVVLQSESQGQQLLKELSEGASFAELSIKYSAVPGQPLSGYLGAVDVSQLNPDFKMAATSLQPGQASAPFPSGREFVVLYRMPRGFREEADTYLDKGRELVQAGDLAGGMIAFEEAIKIDPHFVRGLFALGTAKGQAGDSATERAIYERILQLAPDFYQARYNLGRLAMTSNDLSGALQAFEKVLEYKPDHAEAYVNLAALHLARGDRVKARESAGRAVDINPLLAGAHYNMGLVQVEDDLLGALKSFELASALDPGRVDARLNASIALIRLGRTDEARSRLAELLAAKPDYQPARDVLNQLGPPPAGAKPPQDIEEAESALDRGRPDQALELLSTYPQTDPAVRSLKVEALSQIASAQKAGGLWQSAIQNWQEALSMAPGHVPAVEGLVLTLLERGRFDEAGSLISSSSGVPVPNQHLLRARLAYEERDFAAALDHVAATDPAALDTGHRLRRIELLLKLGRDDEAMAEAATLELGPRDRLQFAHYLAESGKFDEAEAILRDLSLPEADLQLAQLLLRQLRFDEAEPLLVEFTSRYPQAWRAFLLLGRLHIDAGQADRAVASLQQAKRLRPGNVTVLHQLGLAQWQNAQAEEAVRSFTEAIELEPGSYLNRFELGRVLTEQGKFEAAREHLLAVLTVEPDHIRTYFLLGTIAQRSGDGEGAKRYFEEFQRLKDRLAADQAAIREKKAAVEKREFKP